MLARRALVLSLAMGCTGGDPPVGSGGGVAPPDAGPFDASPPIPDAMPPITRDTGPSADAEPEPDVEPPAEDAGLPADDAGDPTPDFPGWGWFKGNLHTHSNPTSWDCRSNAAREASHEDVADWFYTRGWDFFVFTEHDAWEDRRPLSRQDFLVINGNELTGDDSGRGGAIHVGAVGVEESFATPPDMHGKSAVVKFHGGIPIVNHPSWSLELRGAWGGDEAAAVDDLFDSLAFHMEIYNSHVADVIDDPARNERIWDALLTRGKAMVGVAVDDNHGLQHIGGGWIMVWAPELTRDAVLDGIREGLLYASNGLRIHRIEARHGQLTVEAEAEVMEVFGADGRLRAKLTGGTISYDYTGEAYVRARARRAGATAWTQAFGPEADIVLGRSPDPDPPPGGDPRHPSVVVVEDAREGDSSGSYPGADIHALSARLPDGREVQPDAVVWALTAIEDPEGESQAPDPLAALDANDLVCGGDGRSWAGFVSLGWPQGRLAVRFPVRLEPGTRVRVVEVDRAVCPTANPAAEGYRILACHDETDPFGACRQVGACAEGGVCEHEVSEVWE